MRVSLGPECPCSGWASGNIYSKEWLEDIGSGTECPAVTTPGGVPEPWGCGTEGSGPVGWAGVGFGTHAAQPLPAPRATVMLVLVSKALSSSGSEGSPGARW